MIGEKLILSHEPLPMMPWVFNIHGHVHDRRHKNDDRHLNVCSDAINYSPVNLNKLMKEWAYFKNLLCTSTDY
jgi:calcineurin-like phosphoesterase family protein